MPLISGENLFLLTVWLIGCFWIIILTLLILHFFMPKTILEKYFKPPYFREVECKLFTGLPYAPIRTVMFMTVLAFPNRGLKRNLTEAYKLAPRWYVIASKLVIAGLVICGISILALLLGFFVYSKLK